MIRRLKPLPSIQNALVLTLLALAGLAAQSIAPEGMEVRLWTIGVLAGVLGITLALLRTPDSVSHLVAIGSGIGGAVVLAALRLSNDVDGLSFVDRLVAVSTEIRDWYLGTNFRTDTNDLLLIILLQMIIWLIAYLASWSLIRRGWVSVALLLPGTVVFSGRIVSGDELQRLLEVFLVVSIMLLARSTYLKRAGARKRDSGRRRGWASLAVASAIGLLVVWAGLSTPEGFTEDTMRPIADYASETYQQAQDETAGWLSERLDITGSKPPGVDDLPRYTAFDDGFTVGGDLNLSDQPEILVRPEGPAPYLAAQSYDEYTGRGWQSTVEDTFQAERPNGVRYAPELTFREGQDVPYSSGVSGERVRTAMEVTPLTSSGDTLFTTGMFLTADERASVRMSWLHLDNTSFPLRQMDLSTIPPDLTGIVSLLIPAEELSVEGDDGLLYPASSDRRERLQRVKSQLDERFIEVTWTVADDGRVAEMFVTGQVPVYDDNVTVKRSDDAIANDPYTVTSLQSTADEDDLRAAPTDYPNWVERRYLDVPQTVTPRTEQLALELTAGVGNPYEQAKIVEGYLRENIAYDIEVGMPPEGADIVDYVLFDLQRGYCEYYASAMTVMLRILDIPAKTVVGYFPGEFDEEFGGYVYRQANAHAWTEAYFPGYGWIRFEPTAARPASSFGDQAAVDMPTPIPTPTPDLATETVTPPTVATPTVEDDAAPVAEVVPETPDDGGGRNWPLLIGAPAVMLAIGALSLWWLFARSPVSDTRSLFSSMVRWGRAGGVSSDAAATPREYAHQLGRRYPDFAHDAKDIVAVYEEHRYGGRVPESSRLTQAAAALRHLRRAVLRRVFWIGR